MNFKVITVVSDPHEPGCQHLLRSLKHFGYDVDILVKSFAFGRQMQHVYEWCKSNWGWALYTDGYDTFALSDANEVVSKIPPGVKMVISAEKNCYPIREMAERYPECASEWRYVNGGGFLVDCEYFCRMYEDGTHEHDSNDQQWLGEQYIKRHGSGEVVLDSQCEIFQTIAFENTWDFGRVVEELAEYREGWKDRLRIYNKHTGQRAVFVHGNAHTSMEKIWRLV